MFDYNLENISKLIKNNYRLFSPFNVLRASLINIRKETSEDFQQVKTVLKLEKIIQEHYKILNTKCLILNSLLGYLILKFNTICYILTPLPSISRSLTTTPPLN